MFTCAKKESNLCIEVDGNWDVMFQAQKGRNLCKACATYMRTQARQRKANETAETTINQDPYYQKMLEMLSKRKADAPVKFVSLLESLYNCLVTNSDNLIIVPTTISVKIQYAICKIVMSCFCSSAMINYNKKGNSKCLPIYNMPTNWDDKNSETLEKHLGKDSINVALNYLAKFVPVIYAMEFKPTAGKVTVDSDRIQVLFRVCYEGMYKPDEVYVSKIRMKRARESKKMEKFKLSSADIALLTTNTTRLNIKANNLWASVYESDTPIILSSIEYEHPSAGMTRYVKGTASYENKMYDFELIPHDRVDLRLFHNHFVDPDPEILPDGYNPTEDELPCTLGEQLRREARNMGEESEEECAPDHLSGPCVKRRKI